MKRIKWENIVFLLSVCFSIQSMIYHIKLNGLYVELGLEVIIYAFMSLGIRYAVWYFRKNTKEVISYIKDLFVD